MRFKVRGCRVKAERSGEISAEGLGELLGDAEEVEAGAVGAGAGGGEGFGGLRL